jgi:hypothetical protein
LRRLQSCTARRVVDRDLQPVANELHIHVPNRPADPFLVPARSQAPELGNVHGWQPATTAPLLLSRVHHGRRHALPQHGAHALEEKPLDHVGRGFDPFHRLRARQCRGRHRRDKSTPRFAPAASAVSEHEPDPEAGAKFNSQRDDGKGNHRNTAAISTCDIGEGRRLRVCLLRSRRQVSLVCSGVTRGSGPRIRSCGGRGGESVETTAQPNIDDSSAYPARGHHGVMLASMMHGLLLEHALDALCIERLPALVEMSGSELCRAPNMGCLLWD